MSSWCWQLELFFHFAESMTGPAIYNLERNERTNSMTFTSRSCLYQTVGYRSAVETTHKGRHYDKLADARFVCPVLI